MKYLKYVTVSAVAVLLASCTETQKPDANSKVEASSTQTETKTETSKNAKPIKRPSKKANIKAALENPNRLAAEKADDEIRKAAEVLQFASIKRGLTVLELEAGGGYYTELMSLITGPKGKVIYQNPAAFDAYITPEAVVAKFGDDGNRLPNVERHKSNFDDLSFAKDSSVDVVTWFLGPHELWLANPEGQLTLGAPDNVYAEIFRVLKPGGKFVALDHKAAPGTPETSGGDTHRIDPAKVRERVEASGLEFLKESDILANTTDNYDVMVFDPSVRRKTDRFLHKYVKPK